MAKTITFNYEGTDYTLEFTRRTIMQMEKEGFDISEAQSKPLNTLPVLFAGSFKAHHGKINQEKLDEMYAKIEDKEGFVQALAEMYAEPISALMAEPEKGNSGNITWSKGW